MSVTPAAAKQRRYRERLRQDPEKWEAQKARDREYRRRYHQRKRDDPQYKATMAKHTLACARRRRAIPGKRLENYLRNRIWAALKGKARSARTIELVGCSIEKLMAHLEAQFQPGMNWDNYGKWHVDHIIPCAAFDLTQPAAQRVCFHYTNLQPLWAKDNLRKRDRVLGVV